MSRKKTVQSSITSMGFPLLQKPGEMCPDRQIGNTSTVTTKEEEILKFLLDDEAWREANEYTLWVDECLESLLPDEIKGQPTTMSNVKTDLKEAGIRNKVEFERMSREDLRNGKVPIKSRLYLGKDHVTGIGHLETDGIKEMKDLVSGPDLFHKEVASQKETKER